MENLFVICAIDWYKYFSIYQIYTLLKSNNKCDILLILNKFNEYHLEDKLIFNAKKICNEHNCKLIITYIPDNYDYSIIFGEEKIRKSNNIDIDKDEIISNCRRYGTPCKLGHFIRFIIPKTYYDKYKYVYIGDCDVLITNIKYNENCKDDIFTTHKNFCKKIGINFSNGYRSNYSCRLTGLHFFINDKNHKVKYEFKTFKEGIDFLLSEEYFTIFLKNYKEKNINMYNDETFLYLNQDQNSIKKLMSYPLYRPMHGFHIGSIRTGHFFKYTDLKHTLKKEYDSFYKIFGTDISFLKIHNLFKNTKAGILVDKVLNLHE